MTSHHLWLATWRYIAHVFRFSSRQQHTPTRRQRYCQPSLVPLPSTVAETHAASPFPPTPELLREPLLSSLTNMVGRDGGKAKPLKQKKPGEKNLSEVRDGWGLVLCQSVAVPTIVACFWGSDHRGLLLGLWLGFDVVCEGRFVERQGGWWPRDSRDVLCGLPWAVPCRGWVLTLTDAGRFVMHEARKTLVLTRRVPWCSWGCATLSLLRFPVSVSFVCSSWSAVTGGHCFQAEAKGGGQEAEGSGRVCHQGQGQGQEVVWSPSDGLARRAVSRCGPTGRWVLEVGLGGRRWRCDCTPAQGANLWLGAYQSNEWF